MKADIPDQTLIENIINQINNQSLQLKSKNTNDIEHLNNDFTQFLDLGRRLVQFCINDKISLIKDLESLQTLCNNLKDLLQSSNNNNLKSSLKIESLFKSPELENKFIKEEKLTQNKPEIFIPETCDVDIDMLHNNDNFEIDENNIVIKDTIELDIFVKKSNFENSKLNKLKKNEHSTPKSVRKLLNEHGLDDLTYSPTVIEANMNSVNININENNEQSINNKINNEDKYENLMDKIFNTNSNNNSIIENQNDINLEKKKINENKQKNDSLDYTLDFKKSSLQNVKNVKSNDKLTNYNEQYQQQSPTTKKKFKQITMTQAFDNYNRLSSQFKENIITTAKNPTNTTTTLSSNNSILRIKNKFDVNKNVDNDFVLIENNKFNIKKQQQQYNDGFDSNNDNDNDNDDDDDDLIFNFDRPPKKKTCSPNYKHVQVIKKQNERKKLIATSCKECEKYWKSLPEEQRSTRMQDICRHRTKYEAPPTPEDYWSIRFPNTQECVERGYGGVVVEPDTEGPKRARRKRPLKLIQRHSDDDNNDKIN